MENKKIQSLAVLTINTVLVSIVIWAFVLAGGVLYAMFSTHSGRTEALWGAVFFEVIDDTATEGSELLLGIASVPAALAIFSVIFALTTLSTIALWKIAQRKNITKNDR